MTRFVPVFFACKEDRHSSKKGNTIQMKKTFRFLSLVLAAACSLVIFAGCPAKKDPTATTTAASTGETPAPDFTGRLSGYTVVYPGFSAASIRDNATKLAKLIGCEAKADKGASGDYADDGGLEILVGDTNRPESAAAKDALTAAGSKRAYNYSVTIADNNRIVIVADKPDAITQAVIALCESYIEKRDDGSYLLLAKGQTISDGYDSQIITASNGVRFKPEIISTVYQPNLNLATSKGSQYPTIIELQHNGSNNGIMLASFEVFAKGASGFRVYRSSDKGATWKPLSTAVEKLDPTLTKHWEPHLFELPCQVGDMPEGTILLSGTTINSSNDKKTHVTIWRSFNQGKTWEQYSVVAEAGGLNEGLWEPFIMYENGALYCFYSDDSDPEHDQKLVYRKSTDGVNWGELVEIAAFEESHWRPGMISIAKMGNGKYFMPYEVGSRQVAGYTDYDIYFKIVDDLDGDWQKEDHGTKLTSVTKGGAKIIGSAPFCAWAPAGGECGTLFVTANTGGQKYIYVSFDYGKSFEAIENPIPTERMTGYSPSFFVLDDGKTVLYGNTTNWGDSFGQIKFVRLVIEDPLKNS